MYYVIHVGAGNETRAEELIRHLVPKELYRDCFHPTRHLKKKIRGTWQDVYERLIPGYLFLESETIRPLYEELRKVPLFLHLLGKEELNEQLDFYPLSEKEERWLLVSMGRPADETGTAHLIELSQVGFDENDQVVILDGPLKDLEGQIKKINLHKRVAEVEVNFMHTTTVLYLGIELIQKRSE